MICRDDHPLEKIYIPHLWKGRVFHSQSLSQLQQPQVQREGDGPDPAGATPVNWEMFGVQDWKIGIWQGNGSKHTITIHYHILGEYRNN